MDDWIAAHERAEAHDEERATILQALTNYCEQHLAVRRMWRNDVGLSCDELGCMICNGDDAASTAAYWLAQYEEPAVDEDGYPEPQVWMPFDLDDPAQVAEWLDEDGPNLPDQD